MPRLSTLSNPTGLVDIEKNRISVVIDESGKRLAFSVPRLDLSGLRLPSPLNVVVIARRGNTEERVELGSVATWDKAFRVLTDLGEDGTWAFRVLLVRPGDAKLVASSENIRPDGQGDSASFIALEPADLGQRPWEIVILENDGRAVLKFNKAIYHSSGEAEADRVFTGLILPEAIRRLTDWIADEPARLSELTWEPFKAWLVLHGVTDEPGDNHDEKDDWCARVVAAFCDRFEFAAQLSDVRKKGSDE